MEGKTFLLLSNSTVSSLEWLDWKIRVEPVQEVLHFPLPCTAHRVRVKCAVTRKGRLSRAGARSLMGLLRIRSVCMVCREKACATAAFPSAQGGATAADSAWDRALHDFGHSGQFVVYSGWQAPPQKLQSMIRTGKLPR